MAPRTIGLDREEDTAVLGASLAPLLRPGDAVLLEGDLGAGKTTLARALIRAFRGDKALAVPSPSYTLVQDYDGLAHLDLWRLDGGEAALDELGWDELRAGIVVVEWPDRLGTRRPADALRVRLAHDPADDADRRVATLDGWPETRLAALAGHAGPPEGGR